MNNCSPWIHEIYQGIFEICTDLGILVVNAKYAQKYTVAYTRFFAQCWLGATPSQTLSVIGQTAVCLSIVPGRPCGGTCTLPTCKRGPIKSANACDFYC